MLVIKEIGLSLFVENKNLAYKKDLEQEAVKVTSLTEAEARKALYELYRALGKPRKEVINICKNDSCKQSFITSREGAKFCSNKCRQDNKNKLKKLLSL